MKLTLEKATENFLQSFSKSVKTMNAHKDKIPNGFSRRSFMYGPAAIYADHGEGQYVYTIDGKKLLDFNNNFTVNVLGYHHPAINEAVKKAADTSFSFGNPTLPEYELAEILADRIDSIETVKFFCSSSEACLGAMRIARGYTGKNKVAKFEGGYHGFGDEMSISGHVDPSLPHGPKERPVSLPDSAGIPQSTVDNVIILTQNDADICEKILRENADDLACVIMELQSCAGGCVVLTREFVQFMRDITEELGIVLIFDETCTLRAGYHGFQGLYGIKPDLTVMGKIIGGGIPIGAIGGSKDVMNTLEKDVIISGTHHGHLMAASAGIATLKTLDEKAFEKLNSQAKRIKDEMNQWALDNEIPFSYYGAHSILGYAFTDKIGREIHTIRDYWGNTNTEAMQIYALEMAVRGYYPVARGQIALTLPMTDEDITGFIEASKELIEEIIK
mgnify:CR=1 FL=1